MSTEIIIAIALGVLTILAFILAYRPGYKKPNILIAGVCDSGKTLLFTQLTQGAYKATHTSLKENDGFVSVKNQTIAVIDIPGHERLRSQLLDKYRSTARAIIYVIDSSTVTKDIKDVAEYLYMLLTDADISKSKTPVLIACNKQDLSFTKSCNVIKSLLEKELTTVRKTRSGELEGTDGSMTQRQQLGSTDADFEFSQLGSRRVEVVECSARGDSPSGDQPDIDAVSKWLENLK